MGTMNNRKDVLIKWVGGKTQLIPELMTAVKRSGLFEDLMSGKAEYVEPFFGGGSFFFYLKPDKAWLNDINSELTNFYSCVRGNHTGLLEQYEKITNIANKYAGNLEAFYYKLRDHYSPTQSDLYRAARFYYINKTCFNGVYRVNSDGRFNVGFNKSKTVPKMNADVLYRAHLALKDTWVTTLDTIKLLENYTCEKPSFIYLDPPYVPINKNSFTAYTNKNELDFHEKLMQAYIKLSEQGYKIMMSNSECAWVRDMYHGFSIKSVDVKRSVNSDGNNRTGKEVIITNF